MYSTGVTGQSSGRTMWVSAERVPDHHVGIDERAVGRGPAGEAVAALVLVRVVAGGAALVGAVGRDPQVVLREPGPLADARVGVREQRGRAHHRRELVRGRLPERVA